jgi:hypothetical protein
MRWLRCIIWGPGVRGGYAFPVRLAGTAFICIVAAFGAAFLVARAVTHETPARASTPTVSATRVADTAATKSASSQRDAELESQFTPVKASLKPRPKPHRRHNKPKPSVQTTVAPATTTPVTPAPTVAPQQYTPPPAAPAPTHSSSGSTHHKKSGGSGGSGTTTIGG